MFKLFRRVIGGQQAVCDCLRAYLREQGVALVHEEEVQVFCFRLPKFLSG